MGLDSKMSAEMGLLAFTPLLRCFEESTSVSVPPTRLAIMRAPGPAPLSPHAVCAAASVDRLQAAGRAAVLLLPASSLFASVDVLYLLPLRDKVRSRSLEPASVRTPLTSVSTHSPTPPASHHLLTVVISCKLLQVLGEHCGTGIIFVDTLIFDRRVHVARGCSSF